MEQGVRFQVSVEIDYPPFILRKTGFFLVLTTPQTPKNIYLLVWYDWGVVGKQAHHENTKKVFLDFVLQ